MRNYTDTQAPPSPTSPMVKVKVIPGGKSPRNLNKGYIDLKPGKKSSRLTLPSFEKVREFSLQKMNLVETKNNETDQSYSESKHNEQASSLYTKLSVVSPQKNFSLNPEKQKSAPGNNSRQMEAT